MPHYLVQSKTAVDAGQPSHYVPRERPNTSDSFHKLAVEVRILTYGVDSHDGGDFLFLFSAASSERVQGDCMSSVGGTMERSVSFVDLWESLRGDLSQLCLGVFLLAP